MNQITIHHAFQNIKETCQQHLEILYPKGIPEEIESRYQKELSYLESSSYIDDFEIYRRLSDEAQKSSTIITTRGTLSGSFLYYLLGDNNFNPLPPYYYCTNCGHFEMIDTSLFGIDLPAIKCPHCESEIYADGFNLPIESVWGSNGKKFISFEYNINSEFFPFAKRILQTTYPQNEIIPWGMFEMDSVTGTSQSGKPSIGVSISGYVILPENHTIQDYPNLISYLENGDTCITGGSWELEEHFLKPIRLYSDEYLDCLIQLQRATGIYANELTIKELKDITWSNIYNTTIPSNASKMLFHHFKPKSYKDMAAYDSIPRNSYAFSNNTNHTPEFFEYMTMISTPEFQKYPCCTREDFFDLLVKLGIERDLAYDASERIRKGHGFSKEFYQQEFLELPIPDEIKKIAENYIYLFPRAHEIENILLYAKLAYYAQLDSRAFSKIVFRK